MANNCQKDVVSTFTSRIDILFIYFRNVLSSYTNAINLRAIVIQRRPTESVMT